MNCKYELYNSLKCKLETINTLNVKNKILNNDEIELIINSILKEDLVIVVGILEYFSEKILLMKLHGGNAKDYLEEYYRYREKIENIRKFIPNY